MRFIAPPMLLIALALTSLGCGGDAKKPEPAKPLAAEPSIDRPVAKVDAPAVLEGSIRLASPEAPSFLPDEMERKVVDSKHGKWPDECTPPKIADRAPLHITSDGKLSGVVVALSNFKKAPTIRAPRVHDVVLRDCRLTPSTIIAQKGDKLRVTSEMKFPFMPAYGPPAEIRTLIAGQTYEVELNTLGASPLLCGFTAPCGRTDVITLSHTLATLTDEQGNFRLDSFPAGEQVTVSAWHPLLKASETQIEIAPGETKQVELVVNPVQR
jgi:hypothetical protein